MGYNPWGHKSQTRLSDRVNLQFRGALVPISLWSVLGIVAAQVLGTV